MADDKSWLNCVHILCPDFTSYSTVFPGRPDTATEYLDKPMPRSVSHSGPGMQVGVPMTPKQSLFAKISLNLL